jgi:ribosomal protein L7/L12
MNTTYAQAIQIIADNQFDARHVAIELAKINPELFIQLANKETREVPVEDNDSIIYRNVKQFIRDDMKVSAIQQLRTISGFGLKEAKDVVDYVTLRLLGDGSDLYSLKTKWDDLSPRQQAAATKIINS